MWHEMYRKHTSLTLHGSDGVSRGGGLLVDHEGLSAHLQILPSHDVEDWAWHVKTNKLGPHVVKSTKTNGLLTELWEDGVQGLLEIILLDLFIKVVYVDCVVWGGRLHVGTLKYIRQYQVMDLFQVTPGDGCQQAPPEILQDVRSFISERSGGDKISANTSLTK